MNIIDIFTDPLIFSMFIGAILIGVMIAVSASLLGVTLVLKKYSMLGDGLAHIGFGAMAVTALVEKILDDALARSLGSFSMLISVPIVVFAAILILRLGEKSTAGGDSAIALVSTSALALGYIIYKYATGQASDVCSSMFGSAALLTPTAGDMITTLILSLAVIGLFVLFYSRIFSVTFDESFAAATGTKTEKYKFLIAVMTAITVVMGMKMLGTVMISGLIVFPALSAMKLFKTFRSVTIASAVISVTTTACGVLTAFLVSNMPIGPCVVMIDLAVFAVFSVIKSVKNRA